MNKPTRLFDCIEFQLRNVPLPDMLADKENGIWNKRSTSDVSSLVNDLSAGLLELGVSCGDMSEEGRDKIAVLSRNCSEWIILDLAVQQIGAVLTPIYPTININELEFVLNDAEVKWVFVYDGDLYDKVQGIRDRLHSVQDVYSFKKVGHIKYWKEILSLATPELRSMVARIALSITGKDLATIIYTSGTTGTPKGVMLSHDNILSNVVASLPCFPAGNAMRALSFLPLNHIFERMVSYIYLFNGTSIYYAESLESIGENLKEIKPHIFTTVPRLLEKVYDKIMSKGLELTGVKRKLFIWAHKLAERFEINQDMGIVYRMQLAIANKIIFNKWREALGNNIKCIVTGGAACQVRLIRIFTAARIIIMEGYGLTETSPVISVNRYEESGRMFGTVGELINNVEVKIAVDGEILCKGPNIMMGYYKQKELTEESIIDGWYYTGDIGMMVNNSFLKITDRKKEMFKTSGGKYVAPLPIENKLKESMLIENIMVIGAEQKYVGALIVPSFSNLVEWCKKNNVAFLSNHDMIRDPAIVKMYRELVESFNSCFNHVEQIKKFELLPHDWTVETGELTPKLSLKRKVIMERYRDEVKRIYKSA